MEMSIGEVAENGMGIGEDGVFVLTDTALYGYQVDANGDIEQLWRYAYEVTSAELTEFVSDGSGSTPTLLGRELIAITDNAQDQVNLLGVSELFIVA